MKTLEEKNAERRDAVATRIQNVESGKSTEEWYDRPGSSSFVGILDELRKIHFAKSQDYGDPDDALANIRAGAEVVGIEPWRGCVIRIADKMQRIKSFCREGKLANEGFEDALLDLASYAIIALIMFRLQQRGTD